MEFRAITRPLTPAISAQEKNLTEWLSDESHIPERRVDDDVPVDHHPFGSLQVSEFEDWKEVAQWGVPFFQTGPQLSPELRAAIEKLRAIQNGEERVLSALRLVQDEIRNLDFDARIGSQSPNTPEEVFRRRFGDGKDKALLLYTMLHGAGIEAVLALVSTEFRATVEERLPAPDAFDHALVQVQLDGAIHWLEPTRSQPRGPLRQIYVGRYVHALVLRPGSAALTAFTAPPNSLPRKKVTERYYIPAPGGAGELNVTTEVHGLAADRTRSFFQEKSRDEIQKDYLQYYGRRFPLIETRQAMTYREAEGENGCTIEEFYRIPQIWQFDEENNRYQIELYPGDVAQDMGSVGAPQRADPLEINYPVHTEQEIHAEMFEDWPLEAKNEEIKNASFRFRETAVSRGRRLSFLSFYESLTDRVRPSDLANYKALLEKTKRSLGYTLSYSTPAQLEAARKQAGFNWPIAALCAAAIIATAILCVIYFIATKLPAPRPPPIETSAALMGLRGWLVLVAIHQITRPFGFIWTNLAVGSAVFNLETWRQLTVPGTSAYHPLWASILVFELIYNSVCAVLCLLLLALFFKKRAAWPRTYAAFLIVTVLGVCLDIYLGSRIPAAAAELKHSYRDIVQTVVAAAVWAPYALVSKRVKATFRY